MNVLEISNLTKHYEKFTLNNVSFALEQGEIMGFIGRNGAGKSTTLKSVLNYVHPDGGSVRFWGKEFTEAEREIKNRIGYVSGGIDFYPKKKLKAITQVTKRFYPNWEETDYRKYLSQFALDEEKTPSELSSGMKVKYALTLALSHRAELLLLDEPTSGLDPVSRDELLEIFLNLADEGKSILFSTHITSDLDQCADKITYIRAGKIVASEPIADFTGKYRTVSLTAEEAETYREQLIGCKRSKAGFTALVDAATPFPLPTQTADLECVMVHLEKESV